MRGGVCEALEACTPSEPSRGQRGELEATRTGAGQVGEAAPRWATRAARGRLRVGCGGVVYLPSVGGATPHGGRWLYSPKPVEVEFLEDGAAEESRSLSLSVGASRPARCGAKGGRNP